MIMPGGSREGGHDDPQKAADGKREPENKPDYEGFRDKAFFHLYKSMNIAMEQMANEKLHNSVRCKWAHCLSQTVAALCNLIRTLKVLEAETGTMLLKDWDLGMTIQHLNEMEKQGAAAPIKYQNPRYREALRRHLSRGPIWRRSRRDREWWRSEH